MRFLSDLVDDIDPMVLLWIAVVGMLIGTADALWTRHAEQQITCPDNYRYLVPKRGEPGCYAFLPIDNQTEKQKSTP